MKRLISQHTDHYSDYCVALFMVNQLATIVLVTGHGRLAGVGTTAGGIGSKLLLCFTTIWATRKFGPLGSFLL